MAFYGTGWVAVQDIGDFTALSERLAQKGKTGTETLTGILRHFFQHAETEIAAQQGRIFKLAGDAFYALLPGTVAKNEIVRLGNKLLNLPALKQAHLRSRFIAVKGPIEAEWVDLDLHNRDLAVSGRAIYDLSLMEERTPSGAQRISETSRENILNRLPPFPPLPRIPPGQPAHRPLYLMFLQVPSNFTILRELSAYIDHNWPALKLLKWIPGVRSFQGLLISGFPEATGKEAETAVRFYFALKKHFPELTFRLGLSSGTVYAGALGGKHYREFAVIGDRVNVAARLMQAAANQTMYFSGEINQFLRGKFNIKMIGASQLKGKSEKIEIGQPLEQIVDIFTPDLFPHPLVGRKSEISRIKQLIRQRRSCCIVAEAGMGKSRILYEIIAGLDRRRIMVIGLTPLCPPLKFLQEICRHFPAGDFSELRSYLDGKIKLPAEKVVEHLRQMLISRPGLTLVVEDLHWIDEASLFFLKALKSLPFLFIASSRPGQEGTWQALRLTALPLGPLNKTESLNLATGILQAQPDPALMALLLEKSRGNPFYLEQIIYDLKERQALAINHGRASLARAVDTLPFGIHSIILARFSRFPADQQRILEIAACLGREFEARIISKIAHHDPSLLNQGIREGIITTSGNIYLFKHALFREAILASMLEARRRRYEKVISRILIVEKKSAYEIAWHLTRAGLIKKAVVYWTQAFNHLYDQGLESEISNLIETLHADANPRVRPIAQFLNATHLILSADYYDAETMLKNLSRNPDLRKQTWLRLCNLYDFSGRYHLMAPILRRLKKSTLIPDEAIEYLELKGIYHDMTNDNDKALNCYRRTLTLAHRQKSKKAIIANLHNLGWIYHKSNKFRLAAQYYTKALSLVEEGDLTNEGILLLRLGQIETALGNLDTARHYFQRSANNFQKLSFSYWLWLAHDCLFHYSIQIGDKKNAHRYARLADAGMTEQNRPAYNEAAFLLYYGEWEKFCSMVQNREKDFAFLYYIYLYATRQCAAAKIFLQKHRDRIAIPGVKKDRKKYLPKIFYLLYKKYVLSHRAGKIDAARNSQNL